VSTLRGTISIAASLETRRLLIMKKNRRRGNREAKKPRREKSAAAPVATSDAPWPTIGTLNVADYNKK
jgi:hypothetical protein